MIKRDIGEKKGNWQTFFISMLNYYRNIPGNISRQGYSDKKKKDLNTFYWHFKCNKLYLCPKILLRHEK